MTSLWAIMMGVLGCAAILFGVLQSVFGGPSLGSIQDFVIGYGLLILCGQWENSND